MAFKYQHLNQRQMQSENKFHSWQSVWVKGAYRQCQFDPAAPPDDDPMDIPGRHNPACLYNDFDITLRYSISKRFDLTRIPRVNPRTGEIEYIKKPRHVKWKWLLNWSKAVQSHPIFKQLPTPYGTFVVFNHTEKNVHFPTENDPRFIMNFTMQFKSTGEPGLFFNPITNSVQTFQAVAQSMGQNSFTNPIFTAFERPIALGCKDINWKNVLDTYRYCYVFDNVLDDNDKKYGIRRDKKI